MACPETGSVKPVALHMIASAVVSPVLKWKCEAWIGADSLCGLADCLVVRSLSCVGWGGGRWCRSCRGLVVSGETGR